MEAEIEIKESRNVRATKPITPEEFWRRVLKPVGCWLYDGAKEINGYGYLTNPFGTPKFITAHRLAWVLTNGLIPEGKFVLHKCDVRACINPEHLFLGTNEENMADMRAKGRANSATKRKLSDAQIRAIRAEHRRGPNRRTNGIELAEKYGVKYHCISDIIAGRTWTNVK